MTPASSALIPLTTCLASGLPTALIRCGDVVLRTWRASVRPPHLPGRCQPAALQVGTGQLNAAPAMPGAGTAGSVRGQTAAQERRGYARRMRPEWSKRSIPVPERRSSRKAATRTKGDQSDAAVRLPRERREAAGHPRRSSRSPSLSTSAISAVAGTRKTSSQPAASALSRASRMASPELRCTDSAIILAISGPAMAR